MSETVEQDPLAPRRNLALKGHEAAEARVLEAWNAGRMPHAWLITGPEGIGKAGFAYRVARFVLTGGRGAGLFGGPPDTLDVDPDMPALARIASGGHPDLKVLERGLPNEDGRPTPAIINAYQARQAVGFLYRTPAEADWKVLIVDTADDCNAQSANALLKAIEEPPARALILITAGRPGALLPTVRSRCRQVGLSRLDDRVVLDLLGERLPDLSDADARLLTRLGEGSIGRALRLAEAGGVELYREMIGLIGAPGKRDPTALHGFADRLGRRGAETSFEAFRGLFSWWMARAIRAHAAGETLPEIVPGETAARTRLFPPGRGVGLALALWEKTAARLAEADAPAHLDRRHVVLDAFLTLDAGLRAR